MSLLAAVEERAAIDTKIEKMLDDLPLIMEARRKCWQMARTNELLYEDYREGVRINYGGRKINIT